VFLAQPLGGQAGARIGEALLLHAAQGVGHAQAEFVHIEGLDEVIVRPEFERAQARGLIAELADDDDRDVAGARAGAQRLAHLQAGHVRQAQIEQPRPGRCSYRLQPASVLAPAIVVFLRIKPQDLGGVQIISR
jgi:hypothetical protein